jgi:hypothetical protein
MRIVSAFRRGGKPEGLVGSVVQGRLYHEVVQMKWIAIAVSLPDELGADR